MEFLPDVEESAADKAPSTPPEAIASTQPVSAAVALQARLQADFEDALRRGKTTLAAAYERQLAQVSPLPFYRRGDDWIEPLEDALDYALALGTSISRARFAERADEPELPTHNRASYWELDGSNLVWLNYQGVDYFYCEPETIERVQRIAEDDLPGERLHDALNF